MDIGLVDNIYKTFKQIIIMANKKKMKLLIVEDEIPLLDIYADRFLEEGFLVFKAQNGQEGLDLAIKEKPDLIILDILMPVMDGLTMMQRLRETKGWSQKVPIMLLTNVSASQSKIEKIITRNKPAYYLVKLDWSLDGIVKKAKSVLKESNQYK